MDTGSIIHAVYENVQDLPGDRYSPARMIALANMAQNDFNRQTRILRASVKLAADQTQTPTFAFYPTPADLFLIVAVEVEGLPPLLYVQEDMLRARYILWRQELGNPLFFLYGLYNGDVRLVPAPAADATPWIEYVRQPKLLQASSSPDIPQVYHDALIHWVTWWILTQDDDYRDPDKAQLHAEEYQNIIQQAIGDCERKMVIRARRINRGLF